MFKEIPPVNKRLLLALDISGSMTCPFIMGTECLSPIEIETAMAMIWKTTEKEVDIMGFSDHFMSLDISPRRRLDDNIKIIDRLPCGATDISLPFTWALEKKKEYDAVIVITDNETNCNTINPIDAFKNYKESTHLPETKLIVLATSVNDFSIGETDNHCLNICGFDDNVFTIIQEFISEK